MRLYTNNRGEWFGTQADAKRVGVEWEEVDFPTVKPELLAWLNHYRVTNFEQPQDTGEGRGSTGTRKEPEPTTPTPTGITCSAYKPASDLNAYDVRDVVTVCDRKHLAPALGAIISRLHDELEVAS
jgi:hypothetical protein